MWKDNVVMHELPYKFRCHQSHISQSLTATIIENYDVFYKFVNKHFDRYKFGILALFFLFLKLHIKCHKNEVFFIKPLTEMNFCEAKMVTVI